MMVSDTQKARTMEFRYLSETVVNEGLAESNKSEEEIQKYQNKVLERKLVNDEGRIYLQLNAPNG